MGAKSISKSGAFVAYLFIILSVTLPAKVSDARTYVVTTLANDGAGSLRQAVNDANGNLEESNTIIFGVTGTITLTSGQINISKSLDIIGPGVSALSVSGNDASRVIYVLSGTTLRISRLTIQDGNTPSDNGGGIRNFGTLKVSDAAFTGNSAASGGAVYDEGYFDPLGSTVIVGTIFSGNTADIGGAIYTSNGNLTITNCTFSGNQSVYGGGAMSTGSPGSVTITNSTFYNNSDSVAGAIAQTDPGTTITLLNCTLSGNGGGALSLTPDGTVNATNTIFASSTGYVNCNIALTGVNSNNIDYGGPAPLNSCGASNTGDPQLQPPAYNGGTVQTMALGAGSAAINAGSTTNFSQTDQRGWPRPYGPLPDIGAVEEMPDALLEVGKSGSGTVISAPAGIFCGNGCSLVETPFPLGGAVALYSIPNPGGSIFSGWSGTGCGSTVLMTNDRQCTATFTACAGGDQVLGSEIGPHAAIMDAYSALENDISVRATQLMGDIDLVNDQPLTIRGGYDCTWATVVDYTYIKGRILVADGSLVLDRVVIL